MNQFVCFLVLCFLCSIQFSEASYQCGIRQHGLVPLIKDGWQVEEGQWPWHVAVFNRLKSTDRFKYGCGGTLVNEKHTLTAAHCVKRKRSHVLYEIELHFGQHNLSKWTDNVVIRDVSKIHVHPEYEPNKNDIAVLVMRLPVEYSDTVIPICLDQKVHRDLRELEGKSGWVTGWGMTENGTISDVLRTTSLSVVSYVTCLKDDPNLYGKSLNEKVFCAGNNTGSSPGQGDSGGGMYISDGDRWQLRGIISFGKFNELMQSIDASKYIVFANVEWYLTWIKEIFAANEPRQDKRQKRISELECERFQRLTRKRRNGDCFNRYRHNVMVIDSRGMLMCNGVLVDESHVITTCNCVRSFKSDARYLQAKLRIETYGEVAVSEMACHPKHTDRSQRYDMAILKLNASVLFSNTLIPACLANNWTENLYDILVQTAFVTETIDNHMTLVESDENRISLYEKCKSLRRPEWFNRSGLIEELCVNNTDQLMYNAYPELTMSKSSGAVLQTSNRQSCISTVVGLKVHNEGSNEYPKQYWMEIYARIAYHLDWIEQSIWNGQSQVDAELPLLGVDDKCGIYHHDRGVEEWPWSTAIFHRNPNTSVFELICSGTLISKKHVLTTAQCVLNHTTGRPLPEDSFELHFGLNRLDQRSVNVQMRYVREVHIHPDTSGHNVAVLVTSWPIKNTPFVTYICTVPSNDSEFWNLEGQPAYITGWQTIETGKSSNDLKSSNVYFLDRQECFEGGLQLSSNQYCSDYPYERQSVADRGSGLYHKSLDNLLGSWALAGIVSSEMEGNGAERYTILTSLQPYITWIEGIMSSKKSRRISQRECERFGSLTQKSNGVCENSWGPSLGYPPHVVSLHDDLLNIICLGVLVTENYILASCQCIRHHRRLKTAKISYHGMVNISDMMCHADYNSTNFQHDVGVLRLSTAVALSSQLVPACLGSSLSENLKDAMLQTTLFSDLSKNVRRWPHSTYYYIGKKDECDKLIQESHRLNPGQTCVINPSLETDKFNGSIVQMVDSRTCRFTVIGIGSTEFENPHISPAPRIGIVHRIDHYLDWIEQIVWKRSFQCGKARPLVATRLFKVSCV
ncbi:uncharacterized protein LOC115256855 isoform X1 [Aedes albopictus]|uniref:Peptidase S1 domain-containing protein n=1 Tax=Aedes albopictus TaxID=7160 RepID=A0ABM1YFE1_AEDAL